MKYMNWTEENIQKLTALWATKTSAEDISIQMRPFSRNSIIGKANRLGLPTRKTISLKPNGKARRARRRNPMVKKPQVPKPMPILPPNGNLIPFLEINASTCRSVEGYSLQNGHNLAVYCSNPKQATETFCLYHQRIFYRFDVR